MRMRGLSGMGMDGDDDEEDEEEDEDEDDEFGLQGRQHNAGVVIKELGEDDADGEEEEEEEEDEEEEEEEEEPAPPPPVKGGKRPAAAPAAAPPAKKGAPKEAPPAVSFEGAGAAKKGAKLPQSPAPTRPEAAAAAAKTPGGGSKFEGGDAAGLGVSRKFDNGMVVTNTGMGAPGGKAAVMGKRVEMRYVGRLASNGKVFDASKGTPFAFRLGVGEVIKASPPAACLTLAAGRGELRSPQSCTSPRACTAARADVTAAAGLGRGREGHAGGR